MEFISNIDGISNMKRKIHMDGVRNRVQKTRPVGSEIMDADLSVSKDSIIDISINDRSNENTAASPDEQNNVNIDDMSNMDSLANIDGIEERLRKQTLMQLQFPLRTRIFCTGAVMLSLILLVVFLEIYNPNMILIAGLVLCSALFGYSGGITAAVIMSLYTLYYFSINGSFIRFAGNDFSKVIVSFVGITIVMLLVCALKSAEIQAFSDIDDLAKRLHRENEMLQSISMVDALTGVRNRMALRHDFDLFRNCDVTVMMLDLDDFKKINDTKGHEEGDRVLIEIGELLAETFGRNRCYRYGGDEFVVVCMEMSEKDFEERLAIMEKRRPTVELDGKISKVGYSVGYIHKLITMTEDLSDLFTEADVRMYQEKRSKKAGRLIKENAAS